MRDYLLLLNSTVKEHLLRLSEKEKRRLREKLEFLENGLWDAGVRVKKLRGVSDRTIFEARVSKGERILFTLGRHDTRTIVYVWGIVDHDSVSGRARSVLPENAPFLRFEPAEQHHMPEAVIDDLDPGLFTQEDLEERTPRDYGPQKWLVLTHDQWDRLIRASAQDGIELFLHLTTEQGVVLGTPPPLLLSGTAGSGKTTLAVYYLLRRELLDRRRAFITCSPNLKRFSERIYDGLMHCSLLYHGTRRPEFHVFNDLVFDVLRAAGESPDPAKMAGLAEFTRIISALPQARSYDPELVWEETRSIIKGAKPPVSLNRYRQLVKGFENGRLSDCQLTELQDFLLGLRSFDFFGKIERFVEKRGHAPSFEAFVSGLRPPDDYAAADDHAAAGGPSAGAGNHVAAGTLTLLREILRLVDKKASGFSSPLLSLSEYQMLGRKRAPNFVYDREEIHAIARYYQERLEEEGRFDEIDLARRALQLFQKTGYENGRFSYDFIACDEVQDFSDIQLALIFRLVDSCRNLLLAGDTRQIINPSGFRWEEVRARFYERGVEVPEVIYLTLNFRCVGNVVRLANALLDLKRRLVGLSGSERREEWKFSGKPPVLVHGLEERQVLDLAGITGAGQVFLVRSSAEASMLKKALGTELVFTLHEAKGLEFDTVFLWKFGCDRKAAAVWRKIKKGLSFDRDHPHIRHEINLLYVAVTRARSTLIVYDGPGPADVWKMDELEGLLFRTGSAEDLENAWRRVSTPAEWEEQGDYFFERERYRAAAECYKNAGDAANEEKARAFVLELEGDHWAAAPLFERHGYPDRAAASYEQAGDPERALALWEALGEQERARQCRIRMHEIHRDFELAAAELEKSGDTEGALRNWERAGNHLQAARCRYRMKRFEQAAQSFEKAGAVDDACRCYTKLKQHSKAAELYFRSGRFEQAASLYRKLKNTDMLARCLEKTGDLYQLALLHQKAKRIKEAVACFEKFAAESDENRARLLAEAVSYEGSRTALKAALRYSALGAYADSAPLLHKKGYFKAALRDYERAGNHEGAAACHDALGDHYMEALEIEKSSHPDRENLAFLALHKHLAMAFESPRRAANILFAEADRFMKGGDYVRALTRYKVLQHAEGVCQAYLHLDRDDEALDYLISRGLLEEADDYLDKPGLTVTTRALEAAFRDLRTERSWRDFGTVDVIVHLLIRIGTACLRHDAGTALVVQRIVSYLSRHHFFDFKRFFPAEYLALALDLGNCNALFRVLDLNLRVGWSKTGSESIEGEPAAFLAAVRETAQMRKDKSLLALYYYFYDPQRFETVLGELDIGGLEIEQFDAEQLFADQQTDSADVPFNYELFANSGSHYTRAARYLAASGKVKHAARVCIIRRDLLEAARIHEQAGDLKSAGRYYRDGKDYQRALACFRKLDDTAGMARVYERMGEYAQAVEIWERLGRERDAGRVRKKLDQAKANTDQGSLFEQDGPDG